MNRKSSYRISVLAAATALVLASPAFAKDRLDLTGLQTAPTHDSFIVKYRTGTAASSSAASLTDSLDKAVQGVGARGGKAALTLKSLRRMGVGADVIKANRALDRVEAESLMRQFAADPAVEYVAVNGIRRATYTPNDPNYNGSQKQWHYFEATGGINLPSAWDKAQGPRPKAMASWSRWSIPDILTMRT